MSIVTTIPPQSRPTCEAPTGDAIKTHIETISATFN